MIALTEEENCIAVIRLRGRVNIHREIEDAFKFIHLTRKNHLTLMRGSPPSLGMINRVKDYATWGEASRKTVYRLFRERGRFRGNRRLTDKEVKERLGFNSIEELSNSVYELKTDLWDLHELKPVFRLHPPRGGFHGSIKKPYPEGELGYRGEKINDLIAKMI